jgi:uncharacterized BrkB/YihY/UPF0761 family membrane protein
MKPRITKFSTVLCVIGSIMLFLVTISIVWHLLAAEFPTHSDVFWIGVQSGALGVLSIIFLAFGLFFLYRIIRAN